MPGTPIHIGIVAALLILAGILGDALNYAVGARLGSRLCRSHRTWLLNPRHLATAQRFYERHGGKTVILARFVPIVRTFAPFVAGMGQMRYGRFALFNIVGAVAWVLIFVGLGYTVCAASAYSHVLGIRRVSGSGVLHRAVGAHRDFPPSSVGRLDRPSECSICRSPDSYASPSLSGHRRRWPCATLRRDLSPGHVRRAPVGRSLGRLRALRRARLETDPRGVRPRVPPDTPAAGTVGLMLLLAGLTGAHVVAAGIPWTLVLVPGSLLLAAVLVLLAAPVVAQRPGSDRVRRLARARVGVACGLLLVGTAVQILIEHLA